MRGEQISVLLAALWEGEASTEREFITHLQKERAAMCY